MTRLKKNYRAVFTCKSFEIALKSKTVLILSFSRSRKEKPAILLWLQNITSMSILVSSGPISLSNDPDKNYSIFYCSAAIRIPHIETVVFSVQEFINRWKAGL